MDVIIYSHPDNSKKNKLLKKISELIHPEPVMILDLDRLFHLLRSKMSGRVIVLFLISFDQELDRLLDYRSSLFNIKLIIILPASGEVMASKGLSLKPRYLSYEQPEFWDVCSALKKMVKTYSRQP
jgi:hypothetical protein